MVLEAELPAGLTHAGSREFLVTEGLPERAALLDFRRLAAGPPKVLTAGQGGEVLGDGRLFVLGETDYCGSLVVLDGVGGEVRLVEQEGETLRHDLLATDLPALAGLIRETEAVALAAADREAGDGQRGARIASTVAALSGKRMRAIDPRLFAGGGERPPAHWGTAVLVASLAWGARPGAGTDGLAFEFGPDLVEDLAALTDDDGKVRRYRPEELPAGLVHEPTRRLLTEVGLPLGGEMFGVSEDEPLVTIEQAHPAAYEDAEAGVDRDYQRGFLAIGWWPHDLLIALDGVTGRLELPDWYEDGEPATYLNRDLSALLYALWTYERLRAEWQRWEGWDGQAEWEVFDPHALLLSVVDARVKAVDPEAFATPAHSWRMLAEDPYTGGLLA
ncbi:SUKH-4 family immunity protein [Streptomyces sp. CB01881]|uniref:SUKH-4 family immunity protein n=1 Tax=Streptomyces sp. CB01881 TaxID=2078691 RepID=UPI0013872E0F|nr:SUKH-4 family immunity protein [Streptomyces sp. CB01881]